MTESLIVGYAPGSWRVIATANGVVMVDAAVASTTVAALWTSLAQEIDLHRVLDALTAGTGGRLAALPSFAVVLREDGATRVAVRGALLASATGGAGAVELSGEGVTTWNERLVTAGTVRISALDAERPSFDLAVRDGVVLADSIHVRWVETGETAGDALPTSGAVVASEPALEASESAPAAVVPDASGSGDASRDAPASVPPSAPVAAPVATPAPTTPAIGQPWIAPSARSAPAPEPAPAAQATPAQPAVGEPWVAPAVGQPWVARPVAAKPEAQDRTSVPDPAPAEAVADPAPVAEPAPIADPLPVIAEAPVAPPILVPPVTPWLVDAAAPLVPSAPVAAAGSPADDVLGDTRVTPPDGVLREPDQPERPGDHDGATISVAEARALRGDRGDTTPPPLAPPRAPAPGRIRLSTGEVVALDRTVVIGRRPRSTRVTGTDLPRLVPVDSPLHDISRSHLELRVEGDAIIATDLQTTNGTMLLRRATAPTRLHPGEPTVVVPGDVLDLGDGVRVAIEELA